MNIINLTPHALNIFDGNTIHEIAPSGNVARVAQNRETLDNVAGLPVTRSTFGKIEGLPKPRNNTIYVVSGLVLSRTTRQDVFAPGEGIRDENGRIIGCKGLSAAPKAPEQISDDALNAAHAAIDFWRSEYERVANSYGDPEFNFVEKVEKGELSYASLNNKQKRIFDARKKR